MNRLSVEDNLIGLVLPGLQEQIYVVSTVRQMNVAHNVG